MRVKDAIVRDREHLLTMLNGPAKQAWEDGVYRFYHQSHKVFRLQKLTREIVGRLQTLLPEQSMNSWFLEIIEDGATKTFGPNTNAEWSKVTRPIVEAFCHAKYFLEMACEEHEELVTEFPSADGGTREIRIVTSGWSALLTLFNIH